MVSAFSKFFSVKKRGNIAYIFLFFLLSLVSLAPPIYVTIYYDGNCDEKAKDHFPPEVNSSATTKWDILAIPTVTDY